MFKRPINKLATAGFVCSTIVGTLGAGPTTPSIGASTSTATTFSAAGVYSKLTAEQLKDKVSSRVYLSEDVSRSIKSDPLVPTRSWPNYSFFGYEHFPSANVSYGFVMPYTYEKEVYSRFKGNIINQSFGFLPYISYLASPAWLYTAECGFFTEGYNQKAFDSNNNPFFRLSQQAFTHQAGAYATWIGPHHTYGITLRGGFYYTNQRIRSAIDNFGNFYPTSHFEATAASVSTRLKYFPNTEFWNAFLHIQADYRLMATSRLNVYRQFNFTQNRFFQVGPGMHINFNKTWEVRLMYLYGLRFGYAKENRIGIRLRAAF